MAVFYPLGAYPARKTATGALSTGRLVQEMLAGPEGLICRRSWVPVADEGLLE
jgi:hypothetical protein